MNEFILKVLSTIEEYSVYDDIWWRTDEEFAPITFFVKCNDLFFWGCADDEVLTPENIDQLCVAYEDAGKAKKYAYSFGSLLFCARIRKQRPQGAYYEYIPKELWPLFNECGPERVPGFGNPYDIGEHNPKEEESE